MLVRQFSIFTLVGAVGTITHYLTLVILVEVFFINAVVASAFGATVGAFTNYFLNYIYTFRSTIPHIKSLPKFMSIATAGFALNALIMFWGTEVVQIYYLFSQIIATGIVLIWNFIGNKYWTFSGEDT